MKTSTLSSGAWAVMADYFLVHDGCHFEQQVRPALGEAWRRHSFAPCLELCRALAPAARQYLESSHASPEEPLVGRLGGGLAFDRARWRTLAGEVLLFAAVEVPEFPTDLGTLVFLLAPDRHGAEDDPAARTPIEQALRGSRELTFGAAVYRPLHAGWNNTDDVARLADALGRVDCSRWTEDDLAGLPGLPSPEDQAEELLFAREWFPILAELYRGARDRGQVVVLEKIY